MEENLIVITDGNENFKKAFDFEHCVITAAPESEYSFMDHIPESSWLEGYKVASCCDDYLELLEDCPEMFIPRFLADWSRFCESPWQWKKIVALSSGEQLLEFEARRWASCMVVLKACDTLEDYVVLLWDCPEDFRSRVIFMAARRFAVNL